MDIAGVIIGSIALLLSLFASVVPGVRLVRYFRFRKPVFKIRDAQLDVRRVPPESEGHVLAGPGHIVLDVRGASQPMLLREYEVFAFQRLEGESPGGVGLTGPEINVQLPPEKWVTVRLEVELGYIVGKHDDIPRTFELEAYIKSPEEVFVVTVPLFLTQGKDKYLLDKHNEWRRFARKTYWRNRNGLIHRLRSVFKIPSR